MLDANIGAPNPSIRTGLARMTAATTNLSDFAAIASPFSHVCFIGRHVDGAWQYSSQALLSLRFDEKSEAGSNSSDRVISSKYLRGNAATRIGPSKTAR